MTLGKRVQVILKERNIKQIDFARSLGISANYVNLLANDKKSNMSHTLAKLIEETYGYSAQWVLNETGEKSVRNQYTASKIEILKKIQKLSDNEVIAVLTFVETMENLQKKFSGAGK